SWPKPPYDRANASIHAVLRRKRHSGGLHLVGEQQNQPFQLSFNPSLKVDFQASRVTSDGGLLLVRELDERLGLSELIAEHLTDSRGKKTQMPMAHLLRQAVYSRLAGYEGGEDDPHLLSPFSREPGAAVAEPVGLQSGEFMAAAGVAQANRELVADQLATTAGEDRRTACETCPLLRRSVAKAGGIRGHFGLCCCGWQIVGSAPEGKSFYGVANRRDGCTMVPYPRSKRKFRFKDSGVRRFVGRKQSCA